MPSWSKVSDHCTFSIMQPLDSYSIHDKIDFENAFKFICIDSVMKGHEITNLINF